MIVYKMASGEMTVYVIAVIEMNLDKMTLDYFEQVYKNLTEDKKNFDDVTADKITSCYHHRQNVCKTVYEII